jgi:small-conductance mechanosensitive channel
MPQWLTEGYWEERLAPVAAWLRDHVLNVVGALELLFVILALMLARVAGRPVKNALYAFAAKGGWQRRLAHVAVAVAVPVLWLVLIEIGSALMQASGQPFYTLRIAASLLSAWVVITILAAFVRNRALSRFIALFAWSIAALNILGLLDPAMTALSALALDFGTVRVTALNILSAALVFVILFWLAISVANLLEQQLARSSSITPSLQVLFSKLVKIALLTLALILGLTASGINLTTFAVLGGALGLGLGFGLQKVISNLVSGVILLLDRSIKPGDVIEFGDTYGWINKLAARYTSVVTRNGTEYLIPNEDMITQPVINWSHSNPEVRRHIPVTVAYDADVRLAMSLMVEAAKTTERVLMAPAPNCLLIGFGERGLDLELRVWIRDPQHGVRNVASEILLGIWDRFQANGIRVPLPQREVKITERAVNPGEAPGAAPAPSGGS